MKKFTSTYFTIYKISEKDVKEWYESNNKTKWKDLDDNEKIEEVENYSNEECFNNFDFHPIVNKYPIFDKKPYVIG